MLNISGVALYESKLLSVRSRDGELTVGDLSKMADRIVDAVRRINTLHPPDVVALGCTSGAMVMGPEVLAQKVREVYPNAAVTDPLMGLLAALNALESQRVCFISPYPQSVTEMMTGQLRAAGYDVPSIGTFQKQGANNSADAPFISPESIADAVHQLGRSDQVDTVFVACTQMRAAGLLETLEKDIGKPVLTSNQTLCWHALRLAGYGDPVAGWGALFRAPMKS